MHLVVRAFPALPSKEPDVEAFARELAGGGAIQPR
jgi:hypothetical protein